jgi:hypothetical protein
MPAFAGMTVLVYSSSSATASFIREGEAGEAHCVFLRYVIRLSQAGLIFLASFLNNLPRANHPPVNDGLQKNFFVCCYVKCQVFFDL